MEKTRFTDEQVAALRTHWSTVKTVDLESASKGFNMIFTKCDNDMVVQLARAKINFVSTAALFEAKRRGITIL